MLGELLLQSDDFDLIEIVPGYPDLQTIGSQDSILVENDQPGHQLEIPVGTF